MTWLLGSPVASMRQRLSSALMVPLPRRIEAGLLSASHAYRVRALAPAPAGTGLKPVPGDAGLPLLGHTLDYIRFGSDFTRDRHDRFGPVSWMGAFGTRVIIIAGPDATQQALTTEAKAFSQDGWTYLIDAFFHRGLMLMSFDEHKMHRRIMQEAFTRTRLTAYTGKVSPTVRAAITDWPVDTTTRIYPLLKALTLDIATEVFMGGRGGKDDADAINGAFVATVRAASAIVRAPIPGTRYHAGTTGRRVLEDYFTRHLPEARSSGGDDLFAGLCDARTETGEQFSDDDIVSHMIFLMMAAHDTSTITTTAAMYYLAKHPEWQQRARAESDALGDRTPTIDDLETLTTLDLVIKETLRLVAPVPIVMRKTVRDVAIGGHHIPADTLVAIAPAVNHFDTAVWSKPDVFDPNRFTDARAEDHRHRFGWIPFGGGAHKCIGLVFGQLEIKAVMHRVLQNYRLELPHPGYKPKYDFAGMPIPLDGMNIVLKPPR